MLLLDFLDFLLGREASTNISHLLSQVWLNLILRTLAALCTILAMLAHILETDLITIDLPAVNRSNPQ